MSILKRIKNYVTNAEIIRSQEEFIKSMGDEIIELEEEKGELERHGKNLQTDLSRSTTELFDCQNEICRLKRELKDSKELNGSLRKISHQDVQSISNLCKKELYYRAAITIMIITWSISMVVDL